MLDMQSAFPVPSNIDFMMIAPILVVMLTGIVALVIEIAQPKKNNNAIVFASLIGLVVAGILTAGQFSQADGTTLADGFLRDRFGLVIQFLLIGACALTVFFSEGYLREKRIPFGEFYPLVIWATGGAMLMATSRNLLVIFLGLEILSIALYVLAGMSRKETRSEESALKYFLLGAFASGFFLYGIAFFYGATGSLDLSGFNNALMGNPNAKTMILFGLGLMLVGLGFKSAFVPFHQWTPDVYQGAPTNVTAFMAVCSKIGAISALYRVLMAATPIRDDWMPAMVTIAMLTMIVGNAVALLQKDIKRILGYSSIANAGYILVGLLAYAKAPDRINFGTTVYFLMAYAFMTLGAFAVLTLCTREGKEGTKLEDIKGLWQRNPAAAILLLVFMCSLIGLPPTAGFWGKFLIFKDALDADLKSLAIVLAITSAVSVYYYLLVAYQAFVAEEDAPRAPIRMNLAVTITCAICLAGVMLSGVFITRLTKWMTDVETPVITAVR